MENFEIFNEKYVKDIKEEGPEVLKMILTQIVSDIESSFKKIENDIKSKDKNSFFENVHALKGGISYLVDTGSPPALYEKTVELYKVSAQKKMSETEVALFEEIKKKSKKLLEEVEIYLNQST